jgi:predicted TIM-barrel fold metal-dependent hydrolase
MALDFKLFDPWINIVPQQPEYGNMDVSYLFPDLAARYIEGRSTEQILAEMDEAGVEQAVLAAGYDKLHDDTTWTLQSIEKYPDRFFGSLVVDPHKGMDGVRELEHRVKNDGFKMARIMAFHTLIPYNDPRCYPLYAKCIELDIPISINVGVPGPLVPAARLQDPIVLDEICAFFPELKIIMAHGGDPWASVCVKLMLKWKNLNYMTSAYAPKHLPKEIVHYMNTRGPDRIMWASDYPLLGFDRCATEIEAMDLRDEERRRKFGRENARRVILGEA